MLCFGSPTMNSRPSSRVMSRQSGGRGESLSGVGTSCGGPQESGSRGIAEGTWVVEGGPGFWDEGCEREGIVSEEGAEDEGPAASEDADEAEASGASGASGGWEGEVEG